MIKVSTMLAMETYRMPWLPVPLLALCVGSWSRTSRGSRGRGSRIYPQTPDGGYVPFDREDAVAVRAPVREEASIRTEEALRHD